MDPDKRHVIPMNPLNFLTLPIDSKHLLALLPECHPENRNKVLRFSSDGLMDTLSHNVQQTSRADRFLLGSENGLKAYVKMMEKIGKKINQG